MIDIILVDIIYKKVIVNTDINFNKVDEENKD